MARYINVDAIESKKFISWTCPEFFDEGAREQQAYQIGWNNAIEAVMENEPTADVVERKKGEWIFNPTDAIEMMFTKPKCSECGFESADGGNFCSNCGAEMQRG